MTFRVEAIQVTAQCTQNNRSYKIINSGISIRLCPSMSIQMGF